RQPSAAAPALVHRAGAPQEQATRGYWHTPRPCDPAAHEAGALHRGRHGRDRAVVAARAAQGAHTFVRHQCPVRPFLPVATRPNAGGGRPTYTVAAPHVQHALEDAPPAHHWVVQVLVHVGPELHLPRTAG
ncbi:unnamed protein product, partial [Heterosigma akashiwo]